MRTVWILGLAAAAMVAAEVGIAPRPTAADYSAQAPSKGAVLAAALVPPDQIKRIFAADLDRSGYLVFEVAVYPDEGRQPVMDAADFVLAAPPSTETIHLADPAAIAAAVFPYEKPQAAPGKTPAPAKAATRGDASGVGRSGAARGAAGATPASAHGSTDQARVDLEFALAAKALPSGKITNAVAGYLYFRKPAGGKALRYTLTWFGPDAPTRLMVRAVN